MSLARVVPLSCEGCGGAIEARVAESVNAERDPQLREAILARSFHSFVCAACGARTLVDGAFLYIDLGRGEFYGVFPEQARERARACAEQVAAAFDSALGSGAGNAAARVGERVRCRVCFGLEELREKIVARAAGLSDLALEALKGAVLRERADLAEELVQTLRLDGIEPGDGALVLRPERAGEPARVDQSHVMLIERALYDAIAAQPWQEILRSLPGLASGPHVSLLRLGDDADAG